MSNSYCTITQFGYFYDQRVTGMLSNDANQRGPDSARIQFLLDVAASELESHLSGRYALPLASVPLVLCQWVAARAVDRLFGRRTDSPKKVQEDVKWADEWIKALDNGVVNIVGCDRAIAADMISVESPDGSSRFDQVKDFDHPPPNSRTDYGM